MICRASSRVGATHRAYEGMSAYMSLLNHWISALVRTYLWLSQGEVHSTQHCKYESSSLSCTRLRLADEILRTL